MSFGDQHEPTARELRYFGLLLAAFFGVVGIVALWRWHTPVAAGLSWSLALMVACAYYTLPPLRRPLLLTWRAMLRPLEQTVSYLVLAIAYYLVFTPVGLVLRLLGRDPLVRGFEPQSQSYFVRRQSESDPARYFRQF